MVVTGDLVLLEHEGPFQDASTAEYRSYKVANKLAETYKAIKFD